MYPADERDSSGNGAYTPESAHRAAIAASERHMSKRHLSLSAPPIPVATLRVSLNLGRRLCPSRLQAIGGMLDNSGLVGTIVPGTRWSPLLREANMIRKALSVLLLTLITAMAGCDLSSLSGGG